MSELKPCPFCGGEAAMYREYGRRSWTIFIKCEVCEAQSRVHETRKKPDEDDFWECAAAANAERDWNRRKSDHAR